MPEGISHLLVPTDFRPASREATRLALGMALEGNGRVTLLHVIPEEPLHGLDAVGYLHRALWSPPFRGTDPERSAALDRLVRDVHPEWRDSLPIQTAVRRGDVAAEVARYAQEEAVDLILVGVDRPSWRFALGPRRSEQIVRATPCQVLTVHARPQVSRAWWPWWRTPAAGRSPISTDA